MLTLLLLLLLPGDGKPAKNSPAPAPSLSISEINDAGEPPLQLGGVRRIYVDVFTGGESAAHLREEIIGALQRSKLFVITENEERADAVLKGAAKDEAFMDHFHSSDDANARTQFGTSSGGSYGKYNSTHSSLNSGGGMGDSESTDITERKHEARAAVRLVSPDGDVIWSTTQESLGAKFQSAGEDVAQRVARQLAADYRKDRAEKETAAPETGAR